MEKKGERLIFPSFKILSQGHLFKKPNCTDVFPHAVFRNLTKMTVKRFKKGKSHSLTRIKRAVEETGADRSKNFFRIMKTGE